MILSLSFCVPTTAAQAQATAVDTAALVTIPLGPPVSPRRAFVRSLLMPGYGQVSLDRPNVAGFFAFIEVAALGMARRSAVNLRDARNAPRDSIPSSYELDPATGVPKPVDYRTAGLRDRIKARRSHYEDWVAVLIFNHLFAAADAYVAAHLWDFPTTVTATPLPRGARVAASIAW